MDIYKDYCSKIYPKDKYTERYINKLIDDFEKKEYHITFLNKNLSLPIKQYKAYKSVYVDFASKRYTSPICETIKQNYVYKFDEKDNYITEYLKYWVYDDKDDNYKWVRKNKLKNDIINLREENYTSYIRSFIEYDRMKKILREFRKK